MGVTQRTSHLRVSNRTETPTTPCQPVQVVNQQYCEVHKTLPMWHGKDSDFSKSALGRTHWRPRWPTVGLEGLEPWT